MKEDDSKHWYLYESGKRTGPFTLDELRQRYTAKEISGDTPCTAGRLPGFSGPKPLSRFFPEFKSATVSADAARPHPPEHQEPALSDGVTSPTSQFVSALPPGSGIGSQSATSRYRDAYLVARATTAIGGSVKFIGIALGFLLIFVGLYSIASSGDRIAQRFGEVVVFAGLAVGIPLYVLGVLVTAQAQILKATLDTAVHSSPFLADEQKAKVMSLD